MKKSLLSILTVTFFGIGVNAQIVNIPDANFKAYLVGNASINTNLDAEIQVSEANAFAGFMNASSLNISDMTGIESFTALTYLDCYNNQLTNLDVSANTALVNLSCFNSQITNLDISANTVLTFLSCGTNQLTNLDVSANTVLTTLICDANQLTNLDVSANTALTGLYCSANQLMSLNVSANTALTDLSCSDNQLTNLNVSANTALTGLSYNTNQLTNVDVTANTALTTLNCSENQLTSLNVSANTALTILNCYTNQLTSLNVSANTALTVLNCGDNQLTSLNVANGNNTNYTGFYVINNLNLTCIEADDAAWSTINWTNIDATASFSEDCNGGVGITEISDQEIIVYPNPATSELTINTDRKIETISIFDLFGSLVQTETSPSFSIETLSNGVYLMNIKTSKGTVRSRFIKE